MGIQRHFHRFVKEKTMAVVDDHDASLQCDIIRQSSYFVRSICSARDQFPNTMNDGRTATVCVYYRPCSERLPSDAAGSTWRFRDVESVHSRRGKVQ